MSRGTVRRHGVASKRQRYVVKSFRDNPDGAKSGLTSFFVFLSDYRRSVIVVPDVDRINDSMVTSVIGKAFSETLIREREVLVGAGHLVQLCASSTLALHSGADMYLALWGDRTTLASIEAFKKWQATIFVTWHPEESHEWEAAHRVSILYDDGKRA